MKYISKESDIKVGDKVYATDINRHVVIVSIYFDPIFKDTMVDFVFENKFNEQGFKTRLSGIISMGYYLV